MPGCGDLRGLFAALHITWSHSGGAESVIPLIVFPITRISVSVLLL